MAREDLLDLEARVKALQSEQGPASCEEETWFDGPLSARGELIQAFFDAIPVPDPDFHDWYALTQQAVASEHRDFESSSSMLDRWRTDTHYGGDSGELTQSTRGANCYPNSSTRQIVDCERLAPEPGNGEPDAKAHIIRPRLDFEL